MTNPAFVSLADGRANTAEKREAPSTLQLELSELARPDREPVSDQRTGNYGYFDDYASEYVVTRPDVPTAWTNYLGNSQFCTVISHHGGGYSYYRNAQSGRVTRFRHNGIPADRPGKFVYLRDEADGDYWSISWQPVAKPFLLPDEQLDTSYSDIRAGAALKYAPEIVSGKDAYSRGEADPAGFEGRPVPAHSRVIRKAVVRTGTQSAARRLVRARDALTGSGSRWTSADIPLTGKYGRWVSAHGTGYTRFEADYHGIHATQTVFVPLDDPVEVWDVRLKNTSDVPRELTVTGYVEFSFHDISSDNQNFQASLYSQGGDYADGVIECDAFYNPEMYHFFTVVQPSAWNPLVLPDSFDTLRDDFLGPYRDESDPIGVVSGRCNDSQGTTQNHCGALASRITIAPGDTVRLAFVLGWGPRDPDGLAMREKYAKPGVVEREFGRLVEYWRAKQARLFIRTPHPGLNSLINTWTLLQAETCVVWSRFASFIEVGGRVGLGYRDTAQDAGAVIHSNPEKVRSRIVELLRAQTRAGYGLHLFDPFDFDPVELAKPRVPTPTVIPRPARESLIHGPEDACSDDHLWLLNTVAEYVRETGDVGFLAEEIPFADDPVEITMHDGTTKVFGGDLAEAAGRPAPTVWEHLRRALEFTAQHIGANGVAMGLRADWNDCLNLGGGETSLVTFLHAWAIKEYLELARSVTRLGEQNPSTPLDERTARAIAEAPDEAQLARWQAEYDRIANVSDAELWDGQWWRRGITRYGARIGTHTNEEGKIFLEHQAWPTIAGITSPERGIETMDSVEELLESQYGAHLNWPAYTKIDDAVGFLTRVYPGVKENAGIFSHPNAWPIIAETMLGRGDRAMKLWEAISPWRQNDNIGVRRAEPYVYAQFVYGRDHSRYGQAENPWLTGTAGWMYRAVTKHILGVRPTLDGLVIDPCIPSDWLGFEVRREWRGAVYMISVYNPDNVCSGVARVLVDGVEYPPDQPLPILPEGTTAFIDVTLGIEPSGG